MADTQVWFITGAGRGMGVDLARAALTDGKAVVATGRDPDSVAAAIGAHHDLFVVELDVTSRHDAESATRAAVDRFGRIDVLVNNAGVSYKGYFEEMTPDQVDRQLAVNLVGPMNVTRADLPVMRRQRAGHIISISSGAGLIGFEFSSAYAAAKAGLEGWMSALHAEVEPFGIADDGGQPWVLSHRADLGEVDGLRRRVDRRLRRAPSRARGVVVETSGAATRRPGEARPGAADHRGRAAAASPVHRRCRRDRVGRAEGGRATSTS